MQTEQILEPSTEPPVVTTSASCSDQDSISTLGISSGIVAVITGVVCSLVFCGGGFVCGALSVCVYNHMTLRRKKNKYNLGASTQPTPVYEEVFEPCSVEMKENVAYGPVTKTK